MTPDALLIISELLNDIEPGEVLETTAFGFLASGGTVSLAEYKGLSKESRDALYKAQDSLDQLRARQVANVLMELLEKSLTEGSRDAADTVAEAILSRQEVAP